MGINTHTHTHIWNALPGPNEFENLPGKFPSNRSFSRLSGVALGANASLANMNICNGVMGQKYFPAGIPLIHLAGFLLLPFQGWMYSYLLFKAVCQT